jgi:hypothetical protein
MKCLKLVKSNPSSSAFGEVEVTLAADVCSSTWVARTTAISKTSNGEWEYFIL